MWESDSNKAHGDRVIKVTGGGMQNATLGGVALQEEEEERRKRRKFVSLTKISIAGRNGRFCLLPNKQSVNCVTPVKFHRFLTFLT